MKITGMFPTIVCRNSDDLIKFASEKFGFKVDHINQAIISGNPSDYVYIMKNENNVRFDIIHIDIEMPFCAMCINVDNFDQALAVFKEDGYWQMGEPVLVNNAKSFDKKDRKYSDSFNSTLEISGLFASIRKIKTNKNTKSDFAKKQSRIFYCLLDLSILVNKKFCKFAVFS